MRPPSKSPEAQTHPHHSNDLFSVAIITAFTKVISSGALPEASKYNDRLQQKNQSQMGVVCIPHSQSDVRTTFSHNSPCSLAGTEKRVR